MITRPKINPFLPGLMQLCLSDFFLIDLQTEQFPSIIRTFPFLISNLSGISTRVIEPPRILLLLKTIVCTPSVDLLSVCLGLCNNNTTNNNMRLLGNSPKRPPRAHFRDSTKKDLERSFH